MAVTGPQTTDLQFWSPTRSPPPHRIKCVHVLISISEFVFIPVNMDITSPSPRVQFSQYRLIAKNINIPLAEIDLQAKKYATFRVLIFTS